MKRITFYVDDDVEAQAFVDDADKSDGFIAYTKIDGYDVELQTKMMIIEDSPDDLVEKES